MSADPKTGPAFASAHAGNGAAWHGPGPSTLHGKALFSSKLLLHSALGQPPLNQHLLRVQLDRMRALEARLPTTIALCSSAGRQVRRAPLVFRIWPVATLAFCTCLGLVLRPGNAFKDMSVSQLLKSLWGASLTIIKDHLEEPTREIYKELFSQQHNAGVSQWTLQAKISRESLERMIETFRSKVGNVPVLTKGDSSAEGIANLDLVMRIYEEQVKSPVSSMLFGDMLQALLIQMQSLKVNMEEEAAAVNALMKANQLSLQMMAAVPALLFGTGVGVALRRLWLWVRREPAHPRRRFTQLVRACVCSCVFVFSCCLRFVSRNAKTARMIPPTLL